MRIFLLIAAAMIINPALADEYFAVTPSGATEAIWDTDLKSTMGQITNKCMDLRWSITAASDNQVTCEAPMSAGQSILGQLAMGNSYSTPPRRYFRFSGAEINGKTRIQASGWMELQMAFGQTRRTDFSGPEFHNSAIGFMVTAGGHMPVGTYFPNHAILGVDGGYAGNGRDNSFRVNSVTPDGAAAKAGIQVGDFITHIAGERVKSDEDFLDALAKAKRVPTYPVKLTRSGKAMTVTCERQFRSPITEQTR